MKTTIDGAGRLVVPKPLRDRLGLTGGQEVEIRETDGRIEIEPVSAPITLERRPEGLVAVAAGDVPPLTDDTVRETLERLRR